MASQGPVNGIEEIIKDLQNSIDIVKANISYVKKEELKYDGQEKDLLSLEWALELVTTLLPPGAHLIKTNHFDDVNSSCRCYKRTSYDVVWVGGGGSEWVLFQHEMLHSDKRFGGSCSLVWERRIEKMSVEKTDAVEQIRRWWEKNKGDRQSIVQDLMKSIKMTQENIEHLTKYPEDEDDAECVRDEEKTLKKLQEALDRVERLPPPSVLCIVNKTDPDESVLYDPSRTTSYDVVLDGQPMFRHFFTSSLSRFGDDFSAMENRELFFL